MTRWLEKSSPGLFSVYAVTMAFTSYFCMYSFRKPFAASKYEGETVGLFGGDVELKFALILSQLIGYALSKTIGIKFNSEMPAGRRAWALVFTIVWAEAALVVFAVVPAEGKMIAMFANGLPLGTVWGLVLSFLEGRRTSEILGAGLSCSYIVASGAVKTVGASLLGAGVSESWMPAATGLLFLPLFLLAVYGLSLLPSPTGDDVSARTVRVPMRKGDRHRIYRRYWPGLTLLIVIYFFQTAYRDFRDNYAAEIWAELGMDGAPAVFTQSEIPIAIAVLVVSGALFAVRDNRLGLLGAYAIMFFGAVLVGVSTLLFDLGVIGGMPWMILVGLGLYLGYVPYGAVLFERTIAALGVAATAVFFIYISDSLAYSGSVLALLYKEFGEPNMSMLGFFRQFSYVMSLSTGVALLICCAYFERKARTSAVD